MYLTFLSQFFLTLQFLGGFMRIIVPLLCFVPWLKKLHRPIPFAKYFRIPLSSKSLVRKQINSVDGAVT